MINWQRTWEWLASFLVLFAVLVSGADMVVAAISLVGIAFVLGVSAHKDWSQLLGAVFCSLLAYASFGAGFFGNAAVNGVFLAPMCIVGYFIWKRTKGHSDSIKTMTSKDITLAAIATTISILLMSIFSVSAGSTLAILDAITTILPVVATLLMVFSYREQWAVWIPYNFLQVVMWMFAASVAPEVLAILVLKLVFLVNSVIGGYNWYYKKV